MYILLPSLQTNNYCNCVLICLWQASLIKYGTFPTRVHSLKNALGSSCQSIQSWYESYLISELSKDMGQSELFCGRQWVSFFFFFIVVDFVIHWNETAMGLHVFPIPIPPPTSLSTQSLWVFPVHQVWALDSCIQPGLVICFTLDSIHVLMLFSWNIPPSPSPTESNRLFYKSVSLFLFCV